MVNIYTAFIDIFDKNLCMYDVTLKLLAKTRGYYNVYSGCWLWTKNEQMGSKNEAPSIGELIKKLKQLKYSQERFSFNFDLWRDDKSKANLKVWGWFKKCKEKFMKVFFVKKATFKGPFKALIQSLFSKNQKTTRFFCLCVIYNRGVFTAQ